MIETKSVNFKENIMKAIRHGEITLKPVTEIGDGTTKEMTSFVVGHSETGHHHVLESTKPFRVTTGADGKLHLTLDTEAQLVHKKDFDSHNTLTVAPGTYEVIEKTEYNPITKVISAVQD